MPESVDCSTAPSCGPVCSVEHSVSLLFLDPERELEMPCLFEKTAEGGRARGGEGRKSEASTGQGTH